MEKKTLAYGCREEEIMFHMGLNGLKVLAIS